jgi:hypothetical protein
MCKRVWREREREGSERERERRERDAYLRAFSNLNM